MSAESAELGAGAPIPTQPASLYLEPIPAVAHQVSLIVHDETSLIMTWKVDPTMSMNFYTIELYTKRSKALFGNECFGAKEVVEFSTQGLGIVSGFFILSFGDQKVELPGTISVESGSNFLVTSEDSTPFIQRGGCKVPSGACF